MQALIDQLQGKVKSYKKQIEEAEEIAALNLAKYRKVAGALGDAAAAADAAEQVKHFLVLVGQSQRRKFILVFIAGGCYEEGKSPLRFSGLDEDNNAELGLDTRYK